MAFARVYISNFPGGRSPALPTTLAAMPLVGHVRPPQKKIISWPMNLTFHTPVQPITVDPLILMVNGNPNH